MATAGRVNSYWGSMPLFFEKFQFNPSAPIGPQRTMDSAFSVAEPRTEFSVDCLEAEEQNIQKICIFACAPAFPIHRHTHHDGADARWSDSYGCGANGALDP